MEIQRARSFYRAHESRLQDYFGEAEVRSIRRSRRPYERLALLLAAKEAIFKALPPAWRGAAGFRDIRVFPRAARPRHIRLSCIKHKDYVVVACRWGGK